MSRIGLAPITLPSGVEVSAKGNTVTVKGPKGTLTQDMDDRFTLAVEDGVVSIARSDDETDTKARHGLYRSLVANMVVGVSEGYTRELQTVGVGYRAAMKGSSVELQVGFSHPVVMDAPDGVSFEVPDPTRIIVSGIDKQLVGQVAANIRKVRPPEPYKGKGIRYAGEQVRRKAGKSGVAR
ncbi:MAG: 50S ribosomal protein L6 [Acidobacteria bacterium]|nr:50S ribosomal protein L6 [Acidobacteriota bacterium]